jgi:hypothetical protein
MSHHAWSILPVCVYIYIYMYFFFTYTHIGKIGKRTRETYYMPKAWEYWTLGSNLSADFPSLHGTLPT